MADLLEEEDVADYEPLAHDVASKIQRRESDHPDLVQCCLLRLLEHVHDPDRTITTPVGRYARIVFRTAARDFYRDFRHEFVPLPDNGRPEWDDRMTEIYIQEFLSEAERTLPARAATILSELADPSVETIERAGGEVTMTAVRRQLDIPSSSFYRHLSKVRDFAADWFGTDPRRER